MIEHSGIRYWTAGDARAPTVVCTHGVTLDHHAFAPQVPVLCDAGYRVVTWDLRGHGTSQPMGRSFGFRAAADDLCDVLDHAGADRAVLVGQSFGGFVAQELCRRTPQRVVALVLIGTPALGDRPAWPYMALQWMRPFALRLWPERHLRRVLPTFMSAQPDVQRYVAHATRSLSREALIRVTAAALEALGHHDPTIELHVPTLLARGEREDTVIGRMISGWAARDGQARCVVIRDAGHLANLDNQVSFNDTLLAFLREHQAFRPDG
jgi:3-oxoadipate enol-lactonase